MVVGALLGGIAKSGILRTVAKEIGKDLLKTGARRAISGVAKGLKGRAQARRKRQMMKHKNGKKKK